MADPLARTHWHVFAADRENMPAGHRYLVENARRRYRGTVICQLTLTGRLWLRSAAGERRLEPGCIQLMRSDDASSYGVHAGHDGYACLWVELAGAGLPEHWQALQARHGEALAVARPAALERAMERLRGFDADRRGAATLAEAELVHAFVLRLCQLLDEGRARAASAVERAMDDLVERPCDPEPLGRLCQRHGVSREHLARVFARRHGMPPGAWLTERRLERARALLAGTTTAVAEIARRCGFASGHHLARCLRRSDGCGPRRLRQAGR